MSEIPDRVLRWIGSAGENLNEGRHAAAAGAVVGAAAGLAGRSPAARPRGPGGPGPAGGGGGGGRGGSVRPSGGQRERALSSSADDSGGVGDQKWFEAAEMSADHEADAREAHGRWQKGGGKRGFDEYVNYVRSQHSNREGK